MIKLRHDREGSMRRQAAYHIAFHAGQRIDGLTSACIEGNPLVDALHDMAIDGIMESMAKAGVYGYEPRTKD